MLSAEGTVIQARDAMYQAVFPLRGKPLNAEKASEVDVFNNKEFATLISVLGCGIKDEYDEKKLKYNKIIILNDADIDGSHIKVLLLAFFFRYMPQLIENGHLYSTLIPLYKVEYGSKYKYVLNDKELKQFLKTIEGKYNYKLQYAKGLGEYNPDELKEHAMQTGTRTLVRHTMNDAQLVSEMFTNLLGDDPTFRKDLIMKADVKLDIE